MGIKGFNQSGDEFVSKFVRALVQDSTGKDAVTPASPEFGPPQGMSATGGVISDYTDPGPGNVYRAHIFTSSGSLVVSDTTSDFGAGVEYLIVGGGGGSGGYGGGGAGGLRTNLPGVQNAGGSPLTGSSMTLSAQTYPVVVGAGGRGGAAGSPSGGYVTADDGSNSTFNSIQAAGGGGGAGNGEGGAPSGRGLSLIHI